MTRSPTRLARGVLAAALAAITLALSMPAVGEAVVSDGHDRGDTAAAPLPAGLRKYVPDSAQFAGAEWMTSPTCRDRGGDFSLWARHAVADAPDLLRHYQPARFGVDVAGDQRSWARQVLQGYRGVADELEAAWPRRLCVDTVNRWMGADPAGASWWLPWGSVPFGFPWGAAVGAAGLAAMMNGCADPLAAQASTTVGAEQVPCAGVGLDCRRTRGEQHRRCATWNAVSDTYVAGVEQVRDNASRSEPVTVRGATQTRVNWAAGAVILAGIAALGGLALTWWWRTRVRTRDPLEAGGEADDHD